MNLKQSLRLFHLWISVLFLTSSQLGWSKELTGRLGLGYNAQFSGYHSNGFKIPGISLKYALHRDLAIEGILQFATTSPSSYATAVKLFKNVILEPYYNFYLVGGFGLISAPQAGVQFLAGMGVEFFIPGLDSVGFALETGATFDNGTGTYALKSFGASFLDAGIHFYF
ncbi:MAG: hypothetical protein ACO3A2_07010 [Bdellovibrionia bacterium]